MRQRNQTRRRQGFTLVEMMVSTALIIFIMVILTQAFVAGMDTFRQLKTIGDLEEKLRTAASVLRKDLAADHFEGKKRLSDLNFWSDGPPREGYFRIYQGGPSFQEGVDGDGFPSYMAPNPTVGIAGAHVLQLTVKRRANQRDQFASVGILNPATGQPDPASPLFQGGYPADSRFQSPATFASQWYEVAYFLVSLGEQTPGGMPRYALYRRQRLLVAQNQFINYTSPVAVQNAQDPAFQEYAEISCNKAQDNTAGAIATFPDTLYFNSPADVTIPQRRFNMDPTQNGGAILGGTYQPYPSTSSLYGSDVLITDVISFNVRVLVPGQPDFMDISQLPGANQNLLFPATQPNPAAVFDTWSKAKDALYDYSTWSTGQNQQMTNIPAQLRITAIQISIRVWDLKSRQARQITLVQDM